VSEIFVVVVYWRSPHEPMKIVAAMDDKDKALAYAREVSVAIPAYRPEVWRIPIDAYWSHAAASWLSGAGSDVVMRYPTTDVPTDPYGGPTVDPGTDTATVARVRPYVVRSGACGCKTGCFHEENPGLDWQRYCRKQLED